VGLLSCSFAFVYIANLCLDLEMRLMPGFRFLGIVRVLGQNVFHRKVSFSGSCTGSSLGSFTGSFSQSFPPIPSNHLYIFEAFPLRNANCFQFVDFDWALTGFFFCILCPLVKPLSQNTKIKREKNARN